MSIVDDDSANDSIVAEPKAPLANCAECPLQACEFVPSYGPDKADFVLVGEAPGGEEVKQRRPFVGKSGQLINRVLQFHNIDRDDVFVTNACLCRPPVKNKKQTAPNQKAMDCCRPRLVAEVQAREPKRIIATGKVGAQSILKTKDGIKNIRNGPPRESEDFDALVVSTFHPAAALRSPDLLPTIVKDIEKAKSIEVKWEPTKYKVVTDVHDGIDFIKKQAEFSKLLAADAEWDHTTGYPIDQTDWLCIGVSHRPGAAVVYDEAVCNSRQWQEAARKLFESAEHRITYHNGKSDTQRIWSFAPESRVGHDTMLAHYATDERVGIHDLGNVSSELLGAPDYKKEEKKYLSKANASLRELPKDILHRYNATDVDVTHRLIGPLIKQMEDDNVRWPYENLLIPGSFALGRMEYRGVKVDIDFLDQLEPKFLDRVERKEASFRKVADINPRSAPQVKQWCWDHGFKVKDTNKKTLAGFRKKHLFFEKLADYKTDQKLHSTYIKGIRKQLLNDAIHANYNLHTVETGRLSSSDPNMQNQPKQADEEDQSIRIRNIFVPREGHIFLNIDYSQIEYRLAGILSGDEWLLEQFRLGRKFHHEVAVALFGPNYTKEQYTFAKQVNFSILYGVTAHGLAAALGIPPQKAQRMIDDWFARAPKVKGMMDYIEEQVRDEGELVSVFGRKRRFWFWTNETWHDVVKEAYNFPLQSAASDLNLRALIQLVPMLRGKAEPVITVHDSITFEVKLEYLEEVAHTVKAVMEDTPFNDICPIVVDMSLGKRWGIEEDFDLKGLADAAVA